MQQQRQQSPHCRVLWPASGRQRRAHRRTRAGYRRRFAFCSAATRPGERENPRRPSQDGSGRGETGHAPDLQSANIRGPAETRRPASDVTPSHRPTGKACAAPARPRALPAAPPSWAPRAALQDRRTHLLTFLSACSRSRDANIYRSQRETRHCRPESAVLCRLLCANPLATIDPFLPRRRAKSPMLAAAAGAGGFRLPVSPAVLSPRSGPPRAA